MYRGDNFEMPHLDRFDDDLDLTNEDMDLEDDLGELDYDLDGNLKEYLPNRDSDAGLERGPQPADPAMVQQGRAGQAERRPPPKLTAFMPSKFSGKPNQDPEEHFAKYIDYLREQSIVSVSEAIYRFRFTLEDRASAWYRHKKFSSFKDLRSRFVRYFLDSFSRESDAALFRSIKLKPGEYLDEFYGRLKSLGRRLKYSEHIILDTFLGELPVHMQDTLARLRHTDPDVDIVVEAPLCLGLLLLPRFSQNTDPPNQWKNNVELFCSIQVFMYFSHMSIHKLNRLAQHHHIVKLIHGGYPSRANLQR